MTSKTVNIHGDILTINWTGSVWVSPYNGQQHGRATDAMRAEIAAYLLSCGEDVDEDDVNELLAEMMDAAEAL